MVRSGHLQCFKFRRIFRQMDVVRRRTSANRRKYSNPVIFSHKLTGIIKHCTFVHWFFPTNWWELSNTILSSPNFSHKLTGIIPQTDMIFPTKLHDFSHKPTWIFQKNGAWVGIKPTTLHARHPPLCPLDHHILCFQMEIRHYNFKIWSYSILF